VPECPYCTAEIEPEAGGLCACPSCHREVLCRPDGVRPAGREIDSLWSGSIGSNPSPTESIQVPPQSLLLTRDLVLRPHVLTSKDERDGKVPDFVVGEVLGEGGAGIVYASRQQSVNRPVAIKMMKPGGRETATSRRAFLAEAAVTAALDHPNIMPIHSLGTDQEGRPFYAMKEVKGEAWASTIGSKTEDEDLDILLRVCDAMNFSHSKGIIHRDLKPANILLGEFGEVLVTDWGLACGLHAEAHAPRLTPDFARAGTPAYMPPEAASQNILRIDIRSDIYLLGAILFECIVGSPPHPVSTPAETLRAAALNVFVSTQCSGELITIARKAMATDPTHRYPSVRSFQQAITEYQRHAESVSLTHRALAHATEARQSASYASFDRSLFTYLAALDCWPDNDEAQKGFEEASAAFARLALERDDLDLANEKLQSAPTRFGELRAQVESAIHNRARRQRAHRWLVRVSSALAAITLLVTGLAIAAIYRQKANEVDSLRLAALYREMTPPDRATLRQHITNLHRLYTFQRDQPRSARHTEFLSRIEEEEEQVHSTVRGCISDETVDLLVDAVRTSADVRVLSRVLHSRADPKGPRELVDVLGQQLVTPLPSGNAMLIQDSARLLGVLVPESEALRVYHRTLAALEAEMDVIYSEDFSRHPEGVLPGDWDVDNAAEAGGVDSKLGVLVLPSDFGNTGWIQKRFHMETNRSVVLTCRMQSVEPADRPSAYTRASIQFLNQNGKIICGIVLSDGMVQAEHTASALTSQTRARMISVDPSGYHRFQLRTLPALGLFDISVDGSIIFEDLPLNTSFPKDPVVRIGCGDGTSLLIDDITISTGDFDAKLDFGGYLPVIKRDRLKLKPVRVLPLRTSVVAIGRFSGNPYTELVTGDAGVPGRLRFFSINGRHYDLKPLCDVTIDSEQSVWPFGRLPGYLPIRGIGKEYEAVGEEVQSTAIALLRISEGYSVTTAFRKEYKGLAGPEGEIVPLRLGSGRRGFVAGMGHHRRGIEVFEIIDEQRGVMRSLCSPLPRHTTGSDILSVATHDWDGDGVDDIFVGMGPWQHYCPAVFTMESLSSPRFRRLTDKVGCSQVALSRLGTDTMHLVAASCISRTHDGKTINGHGLRIWNLQDGLLDLVYCDASDIASMTTGMICGKDVVATCRVRPSMEDSETTRMEISLSHLETGKLAVLWECSVRVPFERSPTVPIGSPQMLIADANDDGLSELLVVVPEAGILVFGAKSGDSTNLAQP
jgi:serine/threonine protein kinase